MMIHTIVTFLICLVVGPSAAAQHVHPPPPAAPAGVITSLSADVVQQLLAGAGMGLAMPAELNRYPGPKHVLELKDALRLSRMQESKIQEIQQQMLTAAKTLGARIVSAEQALDAAFGDQTITETDLARRVTSIAALQGELRGAHLRAHLATRPLLSAEQVRKYYEHRPAHQAAWRPSVGAFAHPRS